MRRLLALVVLLGLLGASLRAQAGGTVARNYGMGKYVPASNLNITWSYYGQGATVAAVDALSYGVAQADRDSLRWSLLYDDTPEAIDGRPHVFFSFKGSTPESPNCTDDIAGNCVLAEAQCLTYSTDGPYRPCIVYRVFLWVNNMTSTGMTVEERLEAITIHELYHVLGFVHGEGGPMINGANPPTACQLASWDVFDYDPALVGWTVLDPVECE